jgi:hypothetical protein
MKKNENTKNVEKRMLRLFNVFTRERRPSINSQMYSYWEDPNIEDPVNSEEMDAIRTEFGIEINEEIGLEIYNSTVSEAATIVENLIDHQNKSEHDALDKFRKMPASLAKDILIEIWDSSPEARRYITLALQAVNLKKYGTIIEM